MVTERDILLKVSRTDNYLPLLLLDSDTAVRLTPKPFLMVPLQIVLVSLPVNKDSDSSG